MTRHGMRDPPPRAAFMGVDPIEALREACHAAGSQKAWADANRVSKSYVNFVLSGRLDPGPAILDPLGLEAKRVVTVTYQRKGENS